MPPPECSCSLPAHVGPVRVSRAVNRYEFEEAFRCLYHSYERRGLTPSGLRPVRLTRHHLLPTAAVMVACIDRRVVGTLSLIADGPLGLPLRSVFNDEIQELSAADGTLAEAACLAVDQTAANGVDIVHGLMGLAAQAAHRRGVERILIAVHPRHAPFYVRMAGFQQFAAQRAYPSVGGRPAVGLALNLNTLAQEHPDVHRRYFGMRFSPFDLATRPASPLQLRRMAAHWRAIQEQRAEAAPRLSSTSASPPDWGARRAA